MFQIQLPDMHITALVENTVKQTGHNNNRLNAFINAVSTCDETRLKILVTLDCFTMNVTRFIYKQLLLAQT